MSSDASHAPFTLPSGRRPSRAVVVLALVAAIGWGWAPAASAQHTPSADVLERAMTAYKNGRCALCHSVDGTGNQKGPLDGVGSRLSEDEIREWLVTPVEVTKKTNATRRPPMPANAKLTEDDINALVAYMASLTD